MPRSYRGLDSSSSYWYIQVLFGTWLQPSGWNLDVPVKKTVLPVKLSGTWFFRVPRVGQFRLHPPSDPFSAPVSGDAPHCAAAHTGGPDLRRWRKIRIRPPFQRSRVLRITFFVCFCSCFFFVCFCRFFFVLFQKTQFDFFYGLLPTMVLFNHGVPFRSSLSWDWLVGCTPPVSSTCSSSQSSLECILDMKPSLVGSSCSEFP